MLGNWQYGSLIRSPNAINDPSEHFDYFYKIVLIGDLKVGKTNLLLRLTRDNYEPEQKATFGVEFETKTTLLPNSNQKVKSQIWDTSGNQKFVSITTTHYRFAVGAFLVYDVTNYESFANLKFWIDKLREFSDRDIVIALVANKCDLVEDNRRDKKTKQNNFMFQKAQKQQGLIPR